MATGESEREGEGRTPLMKQQWAVRVLHWVAQLVGASSCAKKGFRFESQSRHIPRFGELKGGN